ncbi:uncharacterized protein FIBRA_04087 [Fibroporia radiculosa]|uniref:DUF6534 domain-containing protein n=1 Tax=Fibroporia radiculosa TaxID=599839 RepID=J4I9Z3_9APHY|nr:uncharacterized protein FIBRA_04087 [Fibroporia radiculosa]CCM02011.1 predicted protein [Fibroporia radiculosa]
MDLANTFGAILLGTFFAAMYVFILLRFHIKIGRADVPVLSLYGITILQTFIYIQNSKKDPLWSKLVVCYLWVLDTLHISFAIHVVYYYLILNYFDPLQLLDVAWSYKAQNIVGPICISSVQTLYVLRVWKLDAVVHRQSRFRYLLPVIVTILLFGGYAGSIAFWYELVQPANDSILHLEGLKWVTYVPLSLWSGVDVTIALSMSYLLARSRTGFQRSNTVIATIMMFTLNTGAITSVLSITSIIAKAALPGELVFIGLQSPLVPLHTNSFMAM